MNNNEIKVSIVIPIYNTGDYLKECLNTICNQTLKELQIICVDDGSTDNSVEIVESFMKQDDRIELYHHIGKGVGAGAARNHGLQYAKGEYLLILDSDDYFELDLAEKTYELAKKNDLDVVLFDAKYLDQNDVVLKNYSALYLCNLPNSSIFNVNDCADNIFQISPGMAWSKIWKHDFITENNIVFQENTLADDTLFTYSALCVAKKMSVLPERLVNYRYIRVGNQSSNKDKDVYSSISCAHELKKILLKHKLYNKLEYSYIRTVLGRCISHLRSFNSYESFEKLYVALKEFINNEILCNENWMDCFNIKTDNFSNDIAKQRLIDNILNISKMNSSNFLFEQYREKIYYGAVFPNQLVEKKDRTVLYGAGAVGRDFFEQNLKFKFCEIVAWVDKSYLEIGFPVSSPDSIKKIDCDKIIIAIENKNTADIIKKSLMQMGIDEEKIFWQYPFVTIQN